MDQEKRQEILKQIEEKMGILQNARVELKKHFVGIDHIIDKIIKDIEVWYVMPQLLSRPCVICLWGMTGVGKTDLVRRLTTLLKFRDKYNELQLTNRGSADTWSTSISSFLGGSNLEPDTQGILLLDEIQRFRSVDQQGMDIHDYKYQDVWTLLSDGKMPASVDKDFLMNMLFDVSQSKMKEQKNIKTVEPDEDDEDCIEDEHELDGTYSFWQAKRFKRLLRLNESLEEISLWDKDTRLQKIIEKMDDQNIYESIDYSKLLIFISGNLDEAYTFAKRAGDADIDADVFYEDSLKINTVIIKDALGSRFRPEQIARFGNIHVIYPSLSRSSYEEIIRRKVDTIEKRVFDNFDISVRTDPSVHKLIYDNGVFPVQGTRPLFSTISEILEGNVPIFVYKSFLANENEIRLSYEDSNLVSRYGNEIHKVPYEGDLDKIRKDQKDNRNQMALVSVHEAGHAVVYAALVGVVPTQIVVSATSSGASGFVGIHETCRSKKIMKDYVAVNLSGQAAEEMVFGENIKSAGCEGDIQFATANIAHMVRLFGMYDSLSKKVTPDADQSGASFDYDLEETNETIREELKICKQIAKDTLRDNMELFMEIVRELFEKGEVNKEKFQKMCEKHGLDVKQMSNKEVVFENYEDRLKKFIG